MTEEHKHARYECNWYFCWLIERRDRAQPHWMCNDGTWTTEAHKAQWFARRSDADEVAGEILGDAIACEHGFMLETLPTDKSWCHIINFEVTSMHIPKTGTMPSAEFLRLPDRAQKHIGAVEAERNELRLLIQAREQASDTPPPHVAGRRMTITIAQFRQRAEMLITEEQRKPSPDNALIALLCEAVRLSREQEEMLTSRISS